MVSSFLFFILFHLLFVTQPGLSIRIPDHSTQTGFRITLTRVVDSSKKSRTNQYDDPLRDAKDIASWKTQLQASKGDEYVMNLAIGTPPVKFLAIMDTGSDLIWTKKSCDNSSSSFSTIIDTNCETYGIDGCQQTYGDKSLVNFTLAYDIFTVENVKIPKVTFGACGKPSKPHPDYDGIVGMGRGRLSLVSQLNEHVFAYCMPSRFDQTSETSVLLTGSLANSAIANTNNIQTMSLVQNNNNGHESFYYIPLEGISIGNTRLAVTKSDFAISSYQGGGWMIIDSGTTFTYLEERIVDMIANAFMNETKLKKTTSGHDHIYKELKHCFKSPIESVPKMVFHFEGGANWELPKENYIYAERDNKLECLGFIATEKDDDQSIFGNLQQQNMMVLYDLDKNSLSFGPAKCAEI